MDLRRVRQSGALGLFVGAFLLGYAVLTGLRPELPFAHHESTLLLAGTAALIYGLVARHNERDYRVVFRPAGAVVIGLGVCIWACLLVAFLFEVVAPGSQQAGRQGRLRGARPRGGHRAGAGRPHGVDRRDA
jgi:hypothetical protein